MIKQKKLKNIGNRLAKGLAFFSWFMALFMLSGVSEQPYMVICILFWVLGIGFAWFGIQMYKVGDKDNILIEKILKHKVYVIECYVYDKRRIPRGRYMIPHIKVKDDNDNYIDYWFKITHQDYKVIDEMGGLKVKLYVIEDEPENKMIILSPFEEKTNG